MKRLRVGLLDIDSKIPNYALMKLARYWKDNNAEVYLNFPLIKCDLYFASKVFKWESPIPAVEPLQIGGSGWDLSVTLPDEIERLEPDYSVYPGCDYSLGFITRGCIRTCEFCIVPSKEGMGVKYDRHWSRFTNPSGKYFVFLDNNFLGFRQHKDVLREIIDAAIRVDFNQGLDIRLVNEENAALLAKVRWVRQMRCAFDNIKTEGAIRRGIETLKKAGLPPRKIMSYVLIGFDSTPAEDLHRVMVLRDLGADPFVMPYNRKDHYQRHFARWVNHKALFKSASFDEYMRRSSDKPVSDAELRESVLYDCGFIADAEVQP